MALWSWKALLRFSRCWLWKGAVRSRCSAGEQAVRQVAWKEQVRQEPRAAQPCGALWPGVGCQPGLAGSPRAGILRRQGRLSPRGRGQEGAWPGPSRAAAVGARLQQGQGQEAELEGRVLAKGGQGLRLPSSGPPVLSVDWPCAQAAKRPPLHRRMSSAPCRSEFHINSYLKCIYHVNDSILDVQTGASFARTV